MFEMAISVPELLLILGLSYAMGAIPFGLILARLMGLGDLRSIGSGNIGATNVLRTGNKAAAAMTLVLDALKGAVAVLLARAVWGEEAAQMAGLAAFLGHLYPVWLGFRGGKGVATLLGVALALAWPVGLAMCAAWAAVAKLLRISSVAGMAGALMGPAAALALGYGAKTGFLAVMAGFVLWRHRANIARLLRGTEPRIGAGKS
jgi:acyl phosphate:glycerol-3-phosphate acyltransferase